MEDISRNLEHTSNGPYSTEMEYEKESKKRTIENKINRLYYDIIMGFKQGELLAYNPTVFQYLTYENFFIWIVKNNKDVANIFS